MAVVRETVTVLSAAVLSFTFTVTELPSATV